MLIVDAHLDLAYNALRGRDVTRAASEQLPDSQGIASVGLPDLYAGGVGLICATIFCQPQTSEHAGYRTADQARMMALAQLDWYQQQVRAGRMRFVTHAGQIDQIRTADRAQHAVLLLEGADAIASVGEVSDWFARGLRIVGLAWGATRYAGGTGAPGPLTPDGRRLVETLDQSGIIHDASHLAEQSFFDLLDLSAGPVMASHSNCRAIVPTDRQLSDAMIRALVRRDGVIGINFYDKFLIPPDAHGQRRATLGDVIAHVRHICELVGDARHVGLGTDMDGGLGRDQIPVEIRTSADLPRVADALAGGGFGDADIDRIVSGNWLRFFARALPHG